VKSKVRQFVRETEFASNLWMKPPTVIWLKLMAYNARAIVRQFVRKIILRDAVASTEKNAFIRTFDDRVKQDIIPRLLMEYESGSLVQDADYKSFLAELRTELGISLYEGDNLDVAQDVLKKALETESLGQSKITQLKAFLYLSYIERQKENYNKALGLLNQLISECGAVEKEVAPTFSSISTATSTRRSDSKSILVTSIAQRGHIYELMERYPEAIADFSRAIALDPEDKWMIAQRGHTYQLMERYPEAIADFTRAIALNPKYKGTIILRGYTYFLMERYLEALVDFSQAIELDPESKWAITMRSITYQSMERYSEAIADFSQAIELDPESKWAITMRGITYQSMERYSEAIADFTRAIELDPEYRGAITQRGKACLLLGNYTKALQDFDRALQIDTDDNWTLYVRSLAYTALNQTENARIDIHQAIELAKKDYRTKPQDCRNIFNLAIYHLNTGEIEQAKHLYQEALSQEPSLSLLKEAIRDLEDLLAVLPNHPQQAHAKALHHDLQAALAERSKDVPMDKVSV
jgi:tetratricopeptide (TPR) repeat protein